jgi:hypothetical protein
VTSRCLSEVDPGNRTHFLNNSYLCIKSIILHFAARIVILMPEALAEGIKTMRAAKCNLCS